VYSPHNSGLSSNQHKSGCLFRTYNVTEVGQVIFVHIYEDLSLLLQAVQNDRIMDGAING
jgi:hypothetical protein